MVKSILFGSFWKKFPSQFSEAKVTTVGRRKGDGEVSSGLFAFRCRHKTSPKMYNAHSLWRLEGRWILLPNLGLALLALLCTQLIFLHMSADYHPCICSTFWSNIEGASDTIFQLATTTAWPHRTLDQYLKGKWLYNNLVAEFVLVLYCELYIVFIVSHVHVFFYYCHLKFRNIMMLNDSNSLSFFTFLVKIRIAGLKFNVRTTSSFFVHLRWNAVGSCQIFLLLSASAVRLSLGPRSWLF